MELAKALELIYLQIYRLPLHLLILYCVFTALVFCALYHRFVERSWLRPCLWLMMIAWFASVLWVTLLSRGTSNTYEAYWIPLYSYWVLFSGDNPEILRSNLMNAVLFYPAGLLCCSLCPQSLRSRKGILLTVLHFMLFSLAIELSQYWLHRGFCEIDDVLHNTLGAGIGFAAFRAFDHNTGR